MALRPVHNEKTLLSLVARGDQRAFTELFDAYYKQLGEYVYKLTESVETAEEIVQDVFIKIWQKRETLSELNNFTYYLFILSKNQTLNYLRKKANERARQLEWEKQFEEEDYTVDPADAAETYRALIDNAVAKLPPQQQKVYIMSRYERLKQEEIAAAMNLSAETVKKHLQLALRFIKKDIKTNIDGAILLVLVTPLLFL